MRALGEALKPDRVRHCLTCKFRLAGCKDPNRNDGHLHRCSKWKELPVLDLDLDMEGILKLGAEQSERARDLAASKSKVRTAKESMEDAVQMVHDTITSDLPIVPDLRFDDRDFPAAPNYYEWLNGRKFANSGIAGNQPYVAKQLEIMTNFTGEYCPRCSDTEYLEDVPLHDTNSDFLDHVTLLENGVCPKCLSKKSEMVVNGEMLDPVYLIGIAGQRAFKTSSITALESYFIHRWVKLADPVGVFGVLKQQVLTGTYAALTFGQAKKNIWIPLTNIIRDSPWFQGLHAMLDVAAEQGDGRPIYVLGEERLEYRHRRLQFALASANRRTLRGDTRIAAIIDELGLWPFGKENEDKERANGPQVYVSLENQMVTIEGAYERLINQGYSDLPKPHMFAISSPMDINDTIMARKRMHENDPRVYSFHYCVSGDTLIATNLGVVRIDDLVDHRHGEHVTKKLKGVYALGGDGPAKIVEWHSTGKKRMVTVSSRDGHRLTTSRSHRYKVLRNGSHVWVRASNLAVGDLLCVNSKALLSEESIDLCLSNGQDALVASSKRLCVSKSVRSPRVMTPELAYSIGALVAEGSMDTGRGRISVDNEDLRYLTRVQDGWEKAFGLRGNIYDYTGVTARKLVVGSVAAVYLLRELGVSIEKAAHKEVPWSILASDRKSQLAFLSAYIDGDGSVCPHRISIHSKSKTLLRQMQIMLNSMGIQARISGATVMTSSTADAIHLQNMLYDVGLLKRSSALAKAKPHSKRYGLPIDFVQRSYREKRRPGYLIRMNTVEGSDVPLDWASTMDKMVLFGSAKRNFLSYADYDAGKFRNVVDGLIHIDSEAHANVSEILDSRYWYSPVVKIEDAGVQNSYDLTMEATKEPAFTANGIIVHNSTWEMNPYLPLESKFLQARLKANPDDFWRDYGAQPPLSSAGWITEPGNVVPLFAKKRKNAATVAQKIIRTKRGIMRTTGTVQAKPLPHATLMTLDAGISNNSFAFCVAHMETLYSSKKDEDIEVMVVDAIGEVIPKQKAHISFDALKNDVIMPIADAHNVKVVLADTFQSESILSEFETKGAFQKKVKLKYEHFSACRSDIYDKRISLPMLEIADVEDILTNKEADPYPARFVGRPAAHLLFQFLSVRDIPGKTVDKGAGCTDDLLRCLVLAHWGLHNPDISAMLVLDEVPFDSGMFGVVKGGSVGVGQQNHLGTSLSLPKVGGTSGGGGQSSYTRSEGSSGTTPALFGISKGMR